jgi:transposase
VCRDEWHARSLGGPGAAMHRGYPATLARITEIIRERFGAEYTLAGVAVLLHRIGWSLCRRRHKLHYADLRVMPTSRPGWQVAA